MYWYDMVQIIENDFEEDFEKFGVHVLDGLKSLENAIILDVKINFKMNVVVIDCLVKPDNIETHGFVNYAEISFALKNNIEVRQNGVCKMESNKIEISKLNNKMFFNVKGAIDLEVSCEKINCVIYQLTDEEFW